MSRAGRYQTGDQLAVFQLRVAVIDKPTDGSHENGQPMPSAEANEALRPAVEALRATGLEVAHSVYGVTGRLREPF